MSTRSFVVYTDGSCKNNGKPNSMGGWAFVVLENDQELFRCRNQVVILETTNNAMEITAVVKALKYITITFGVGHNVTIITDSQLVVGWLSLGWQVNSNQEAIFDAFSYIRNLKVSFKHIRGHQGDKWNEIVDEMAAIARKEHEQKPLLKEIENVF